MYMWYRIECIFSNAVYCTHFLLVWPVTLFGAHSRPVHIASCVCSLVVLEGHWRVFSASFECADIKRHSFIIDFYVLDVISDVGKFV